MCKAGVGERRTRSQRRRRYDGDTKQAGESGGRVVQARAADPGGAEAGARRTTGVAGWRRREAGGRDLLYPGHEEWIPPDAGARTYAKDAGPRVGRSGRLPGGASKDAVCGPECGEAEGGRGPTSGEDGGAQAKERPSVQGAGDGPWPAGGGKADAVAAGLYAARTQRVPTEAKATGLRGGRGFVRGAIGSAIGRGICPWRNW